MHSFNDFTSLKSTSVKFKDFARQVATQHCQHDMIMTALHTASDIHTLSSSHVELKHPNGKEQQLD